MLIRLLFITLLVTSCGKNVQIKSNKLESLQQITEADWKNLQQSAIMDTANNVLLFRGSRFKVSKYSSQQATTFIGSLPGNSQIPVFFIGPINGQEIVIESIKRQ